MSDLFFKKNPIPMWIYDLKTLAFLDVNESAVINYGYSYDEFLSMTIKDIRPAEDVERLLEYLNPKNQGYENAGYWRHRRKNGEIIFVQIISQYFDFNGIKSELILSIDQSDKVNALKKLQENESRLDSILQSLTDIVWSCAPETFSILFLSKHVADVYGYPYEAFVNDPNLWLDCVCDKDKPLVKLALDNLDRTNGFDIQYQILTKDQHIRTLHDKCTVIRNEVTGKMERIDGIARDISKERDFLENIEKLSENLRKQNEQLKELAFINSHKMRGPLTSIVGALNLLDEFSEKKDVLQMIKSASQELDQVIRETSQKLSGIVAFENFTPFKKEKIQKILQIDDDALQLLLNEKLIKKSNPAIEVQSFFNAEKALEYIKGNSIDLILLDINMPIMNGWEFLEELKKKNSALDVFMLSSSVDPTDRLTASKYTNVKGYITKPLTQEVIKGILT